MTLYRHAGLDPASAFFLAELEEQGRPRLKAGVTELAP